MPNKKQANVEPKKQLASKKAAATRKKAVKSAQVARIDVVAKGLLQTEPPIDNSPANLDAAFRARLEAALAGLSAAGTPFRLVEGFRTVNRQQWLYGSGRPAAVPYGRPGPILTAADGVTNRSKHQGNGNPGSGKAADCYPLRNGSVYIPPATDPVWAAYAAAVERQGLIAGLRFGIVDAPHSEMT